MTDVEQTRVESFGRIQPPSFSGAEFEDAQDFLYRCSGFFARQVFWRLVVSVYWGCLMMVGGL